MAIDLNEITKQQMPKFEAFYRKLNGLPADHQINWEQADLRAVFEGWIWHEVAKQGGAPGDPVEASTTAVRGGSIFLANAHHFYAQTDGSYAWPKGAVADLLKQAKREIEAIHHAPAIAHLRQIDAGTPNACWVIAAASDAGACAVIAAPLRSR